MVEFQMAKRKGSSLSRKVYKPNKGFQLYLLPYVYPNISSLVLTFDCEGKYGGGSTIEGETVIIPKILEQFKKLNYCGTFNFVGRTASENMNIVKKINSSGNDVWGHGLTHKYLDTDEEWDDEEVTDTIRIISDLIGDRCIGWRSPYGTFNERLYNLLLKQGVKYGSNWGNSTWGNMPFFPFIEEKKINICELPFDDVHFDAMIFRKIGLNSDVALDLYKSKLVASINNFSIFTPLIHPVNLAEDTTRFNMFSKFLSYSSRFNELWVTSCSKLLYNFSLLENVKIQSLNFNHKQNRIYFEITIINNNTLKKDLLPLSLAFKLDEKVKNITCSSKYAAIDLTPLETVICLPIDLSLPRNHIELELVLR
ncbi:MAG: polysaccharide deacetylase family protein [Desulfobacterales bacterium]|nr:polysaccharide deacetylase family protein [Desulfobacterales bacterium]